MFSLFCMNPETGGKQVVAEKNGHEIHWYQPGAVIDAIKEIVEQVRK